MELNRSEFNRYIHSNPDIILAITKRIIERILVQEEQLMLRVSQVSSADLPSVFVSYSRKNKAFASQLIRDLQRYHYDVWLDTTSIVPGTEWKDSIEQGLENTTIMVLILSPDSVASEEVRVEWQYYMERSKVIIPVLHHACDVPDPLRALQYIDFTQMDYEFAVAHLVRALQTHSRVMGDAA